MANVTIRFAFILILLGAVFFYITGMHLVPPLIPAFFGVVLLVLGLFARTENTKQRMIVMHIAVTIGLVGFLIPAGMLIARYLHGVLMPREFQEQLLMAVISFVYVGLCVRSFIAARRSRA